MPMLPTSNQSKESRAPASVCVVDVDSYSFSKHQQKTEHPQCVTPPSFWQTAPRSLAPSCSCPVEESSAEGVTTTNADDESYSAAALPFYLSESYRPLKQVEQQAVCILWSMSRDVCETVSHNFTDDSNANATSSNKKQQNQLPKRIEDRISRPPENSSFDEEKERTLNINLGAVTQQKPPLKAKAEKRPSTMISSSNEGVATAVVSKKIKRVIEGQKLSNSTKTGLANPTTKAPNVHNSEEPVPKTSKPVSRSKSTSRSKLITPEKTAINPKNTKTSVVIAQKSKGTSTDPRPQTIKKSATPKTLTSGKTLAPNTVTLQRCNSNGPEDPAHQEYINSGNVPDFLKNVDPYHIDEARIPESMQQDDEDLVITFQQLNPNDVLMGRGNAIAAYPGNKRYRQIIRHYRPAYMGSYRYEKRLISQQVVTFVANMGGSFLEEVPGEAKGIENSLFRPITLDRALEKISQACREKPPNSSY